MASPSFLPFWLTHTFHLWLVLCFLLFAAFILYHNRIIYKYVSYNIMMRLCSYIYLYLNVIDRWSIDRSFFKGSWIIDDDDFQRESHFVCTIIFDLMMIITLGEEEEEPDHTCRRDMIIEARGRAENQSINQSINQYILLIKIIIKIVREGEEKILKAYI